ncbi:DUF134 domain-containing protein [Patescibacteria group bacterium]|nr:DUF134 domain-containing protein [Patescibacteria group bacterium]MBU1889928.1 DUF134 domain-containing protein [Patescibacteria group bacterium]
MVRPHKLRHIHFQPGVTYFKPQGVPMRQLEEVCLSLDESEAMRLKHLEELDQTESAKKMKISQSTYQRVLVSANKKIADALINGKAIKIEGGNIQFPKGQGGKMRRMKRFRR